MASQQPQNQPQQQLSKNLADEIAKMKKELEEKQKALNEIHINEIEKLVSNFLVEIEKSGFDKVAVKKLVIEKLTRKHKPRK